MPLETFTPPTKPTVGGTNKQVNARTKVAQFGDGYSQRAGDGLNAIKSTVTLTWDYLNETDADAIEDFLVARKGYEAFLYTLPTATDELKWVCASWTRTPQQASFLAMTASLEQVFDL